MCSGALCGQDSGNSGGPIYLVLSYTFHVSLYPPFNGALRLMRKVSEAAVDARKAAWQMSVKMASLLYGLQIEFYLQFSDKFCAKG